MSEPTRASERGISDPECARIAHSLAAAEERRVAIPQISVDQPRATLADAYAIQGHWLALKQAAGYRRIGRKIGLTSRAMQMASKIDEPDYGFLTSDMLYRDGDEIPAGRFMSPRLEIELAFVLGRPLRGPLVHVHDVLRATEYVTPALEIIDYRTHVPRAIVDTTADNAAAGAIVVGGRTIRPHDVDIRWIGATLSKNGVIEESGVSAAVMGHPAAGIVWLCNKLALLDDGLEAGEVILAGAFARPVSISPGDVVHADFGALGAIGVSFAEQNCRAIATAKA
jgi:2-oxo-hept-3-ene-1,7-dioate hydratase